jgi:hypothetical protein
MLQMVDKATYDARLAPMVASYAAFMDGAARAAYLRDVMQVQRMDRAAMAAVRYALQTRRSAR